MCWLSKWHLFMMVLNVFLFLLRVSHSDQTVAWRTYTLVERLWLQNQPTLMIRLSFQMTNRYKDTLGNHVIMWTCSLDEPISSVFCFCPCSASQHELHHTWLPLSWRDTQTPLLQPESIMGYIIPLPKQSVIVWAYVTAFSSKRETETKTQKNLTDFEMIVSITLM